MVDRTTAEHLEVLRAPRCRRTRVGEQGQQRGAVEGLLRHAVEHLRITEIHQGAHENAERFAARHISPSAPVRVHVRDGATPEQILQAAEELGSDLIVMGTHGRTGLAHLLLGSVAEKVVRKSPIPVLTVRIPAAGATARDASRIDPRIFWW